MPFEETVEDMCALAETRKHPSRICFTARLVPGRAYKTDDHVHTYL